MFMLQIKRIDYLFRCKHQVQHLKFQHRSWNFKTQIIFKSLTLDSNLLLLCGDTLMIPQVEILERPMFCDTFENHSNHHVLVIFYLSVEAILLM